ncbi:2-keto-4-pentenoate hydratase [Pararhodobacter sp.]|uniref:2-keto-4-pentenoate hydratase n=1 Tax=Pararhodobacter sp. TaxID=2127056 RepID=UPI002AFF8E72|nr:hypothetical protein [Pararhodobacter sp.]
MTKAEILTRAFATGQQIAPFSDAEPAFDLAAGYAAQRALTALRVAAGARIIGMKVGFTNTLIWAQYGIQAPVHAPVFDTSLATGTVAIGGFMEPQIEPEVVLKLRATPTPDMDDAALLACIEAAAPGFEIVHSAYPGWRFKAPDSVASGGMHGALVLGDWVPVDRSWMDRLTRFRVTLSCDGAVLEVGQATNLLGAGPLAVLRHLVSLDSADPLPAGSLVSTGTVTRAMPIQPGQDWHAAFEGLGFAPIRVRLT